LRKELPNIKILHSTGGSLVLPANIDVAETVLGEQYAKQLR